MNFESFMPREFRAHAPCLRLEGTERKLGPLRDGRNAGEHHSVACSEYCEVIARLKQSYHIAQRSIIQPVTDEGVILTEADRADQAHPAFRLRDLVFAPGIR